MRVLQYIFALLLLSVSGIVSAQIPHSYLKEAAENNPKLKAKYAAFEAAMQRIAQVNALPDPTLTFGYFISPVETRVGPQQAKIGLSQMFPWFGTLAAQESSATYAAEAKYQMFVQAKNELYYNVKAAWYPLYELNRIIQLQKENRSILATYKQLSTTAFKNGKGSMTDVLRVDIAIDDIDTEINLLETKKQPLLIHFNRLLNRADTSEASLPDSLQISTVAIGYRKDSLLALNPALKAYDMRLKSAQAQEEIAYRQGLPKFGVGIDYVIVGKREDVAVPNNGRNAIMPMASISLPIFRKKYNAAKKEAQLTQTAISAEKEDFENNLVSTYAMAAYEVEQAEQLITLYDEQIKSTRQVTTLLLSAYSTNGKDFEEVLRMQQQLLKYQTAKVKAVKDFYIAVAKLDYLTAKTE